MKKILILIMLIGVIYLPVLLSENVRDIQPIDGESLNRLIAIIQSSSSSGGSGGNITTNTVNNFTGTNNFAGPTTFNGSATFNDGTTVSATGVFTNNGNTVLSNLFVRGTSQFVGGSNLFYKSVTMGTNGFTALELGADLFIDKRASGQQANVYINSASAMSASLVIGSDVGDANRQMSLSGGDGGTWVNNYENGLTTINNSLAGNGALYKILNHAAGTIASFGGAGILLSTNVTVGSFAGDAVTMNASTMAIPNFLNIGSSSLYVSNNTIGIGTALTLATNGIAMTGQTNYLFKMARNLTVGNIQGKDLKIEAGGCNTNASNTLGGDLILAGGTSSGNANSRVMIATGVGSSSGTAVRDPNVSFVFDGDTFGINDTSPEATLELCPASATASVSNLLYVSSGTSGDGDLIKVVKGTGTMGGRVGLLIQTFTNANTVAIGGNGLLVTNDVRVTGAFSEDNTLLVANQIYTNENRRTWINQKVYLTTTTGKASGELRTISGTTTQGIAWAEAETAASKVGFNISGFVAPNAIYWTTNLSTGDGTFFITNSMRKGF